MPKSRVMSAGTCGTSKRLRVNGPEGGGNALQGLPPITNMRSFLIPHVRKRSDGENRDVVFCVNQLGGVGKGRTQFGPGNRSGIGTTGGCGEKAPQPPGSLSAYGNSESSIELTWEIEEGADGTFILYSVPHPLYGFLIPKIKEVKRQTDANSDGVHMQQATINDLPSGTYWFNAYTYKESRTDDDDSGVASTPLLIGAKSSEVSAISSTAAPPQRLTQPANLLLWFQARTQGDGWTNNVWYKTKGNEYEDKIGSGGRPTILDIAGGAIPGETGDYFNYMATEIDGNPEVGEPNRITQWPPNGPMPNGASAPANKRLEVNKPEQGASQVPNFYFQQAMQYYLTFVKYLDTMTRHQGNYDPKTCGGVRQVAGLVLQDPAAHANKYLRFASILEPTDVLGQQYGKELFGKNEDGTANHALPSENKYPTNLGTSDGGQQLPLFQGDPYNGNRPDVPISANPHYNIGYWGRPGINRFDPRAKGSNGGGWDHGNVGIIEALTKLGETYADKLEELDPAETSTPETRKRLLLPWVIEYYIKPLWDPASLLFMGNPDNPDEGGPELGFIVDPGIGNGRWAYYGWQGKESAIVVYDTKSEGCTGTKCPEYALRGDAYAYAPPNLVTGYEPSHSDPYYYRGPAGLKMPGVGATLDADSGPAYTNWDRGLSDADCDEGGVVAPDKVIYMEPTGLGSSNYENWCQNLSPDGDPAKCGGSFKTDLEPRAPGTGAGTGLYGLPGFEHTENPFGRNLAGDLQPEVAPAQSMQTSIRPDGTGNFENFPTVNPCNNMYQVFHYLSDLNALLLDNGTDGFCPWNTAGRILSVSILDSEGGGDGWQQSTPIGKAPPQSTSPAIITFDPADFSEMPQPAYPTEAERPSLKILASDQSTQIGEVYAGGFMSGGVSSGTPNQTKMGMKFLVNPLTLTLPYTAYLQSAVGALPSFPSGLIGMNITEIDPLAGLGLQQTYSVTQSWTRMVEKNGWKGPEKPSETDGVHGQGPGCGIPGWDPTIAGGTVPPRVNGIEGSVDADSQWHDGRTVQQLTDAGDVIPFTRGFRARVTAQDYISALWLAFTSNGVFEGHLPPLEAEQGQTSPAKDAGARGKIGFTSSTSTYAGGGSACLVHQVESDKTTPCVRTYNPAYKPDQYWKKGTAFTTGSKEIYNIATGNCANPPLVPQPPNGNPYPTCCTDECEQRPQHYDIDSTMGGPPYDTAAQSIYAGILQAGSLKDDRNGADLTKAQWLWNNCMAWSGLNATPNKPLDQFAAEPLYQKRCNYVMFSNENDNDPPALGGLFSAAALKRDPATQLYAQGYNKDFGGGGMMLGGFNLSDILEFFDIVSAKMKPAGTELANIALYDMGFTPGTWLNAPLGAAPPFPPTNPLGLYPFDLNKTYDANAPPG